MQACRSDLTHWRELTLCDSFNRCNCLSYLLFGYPPEVELCRRFAQLRQLENADFSLRPHSNTHASARASPYLSWSLSHLPSINQETILFPWPSSLLFSDVCVFMTWSVYSGFLIVFVLFLYARCHQITRCCIEEEQQKTKKHSTGCFGDI